MKVLVTGGAGYIGSVCVDDLLKAGHQVELIENLSDGFKLALNPKVKLHIGCLSLPEFVNKLMGISSLMQCFITLP